MWHQFCSEWDLIAYYHWYDVSFFSPKWSHVG